MSGKILLNNSFKNSVLLLITGKKIKIFSFIALIKDIISPLSFSAKNYIPLINPIKNNIITTAA